MSSDSDDLDEDELLQIALKEQAQRDLNYQKSSQASSRPAKPVANYVQPPAQPAKSKNSNAVQMQQRSNNNNQQRRRAAAAVEEDDDSEVEMLSISSGDEDSSKDRGFGSRNRVVRGSARDDDRAWDGEEPDCWKRVDETELGRRVREMRETRAVPVAPKFERKPSTIRKGLNNLQSFPRGMECVDPLGLGIIDSKTLRLMNDRLASSPSKSDKDYLDPNIREKLIYFSEKFDAKSFLSRVHQDTSAAELEAGALALKTDLKGRTQQKKQLVKENFDCFVSCKTTIDDIESKLRRIEEDPEGTGTSHLFNCIQGVTSLANRACGPLFERQAQAEKIRSVQGMLQRFRTLFNLPSAIRASIGKGEYDLAVREYRKAKSIVLPSHVGILKRVLEEVEKVMHEFKGMLYRSMEDPNIDLANLENIVRLLLDLEPESDPIWHYLSIQNHRIRGLLEKCTLDHETRMESLQNETREKALADAKWSQMQQDLNQSPDVDYSLTLGNTQLLGDSQPLDFTGEEVDALRGRYIRRLTAVIIHHIPAFWRVALSVFSGKFAKSSQVSTESNVNSSASKTEDKLGDGKYSSHSLDEVAGMVRSTISAYESKVHSTFNDLEESNILRPYMSDAIEEISKACQAFEAKESAPPVAVAALRTLQSEITKVYILRLCSWMRTSSEDISKDESWVPVSILERNKSQYTISSLPLAFRSIMVSAMDQIYLLAGLLRFCFTVHHVHHGCGAAASYLLPGLLRDQGPEVFDVDDGAVELVAEAVEVAHADLAEVARMVLVEEDACLGFPKKLPLLYNKNSKASGLSCLAVAFPTTGVVAVLKKMIQSLRSEAAKSEDTFVQLQEVQESIRLAFLNCLLDFAGYLEHIAGELPQNRSNKESPHFQTGYPLDPQEISSESLPGSLIDPHQQLLMVLSNIGYCKDELSRELYSKYKHIWLQSRGKEEEDSDVQDLIMSFSGLEEKVLAQYTIAKANFIRTAAMNYLLDAGVQWGGAPAVKGVRDAAVELLHTLVAVHAEVFAGCKPLLDKTLGILVEGLIDTFLSLFHENKAKDLRSLDANGFCQLMLELEYFETILNPYFTPDASESLKSLQGVLLEKVTESVTETIETPTHHRRPTRGSDDVLADDRQHGMSVSPDDLIALAQQYSAELLQAELERTRLNTACFAESIPLDSVPESAKAAYASFRGSMDSPSRNFRGSQSVGSPGFSRQRRG
ncbi:hypothetical protein RJ639_038307 [Escallonia herrerae]|uniref:Exocyst complex component EXOC2/Sec5 N-terminal domain-containing protein n=1 Tax=Escallonia herrerae TaxID=1293975 RepID=A0AA88WLZ6_9ASTE|nr:hypothetical protein RJ639_038307 [Escallonia herrerae]